MVALAESIRGRAWQELLDAHGDWPRKAVLCVAVRKGGMRLPEILHHLPGLSYNADAQAIRRLKKRVKSDKALAQFIHQLVEGITSERIDCH